MKTKQLFFAGILALLSSSFMLTACNDDNKATYDTELLPGCWDLYKMVFQAGGNETVVNVEEGDDMYSRIIFMENGKMETYSTEDGKLIHDSNGTWQAYSNKLAIHEVSVSDHEENKTTVIVVSINEDELVLRLNVPTSLEDEEGYHSLKGSVNLYFHRVFL